MLADPGAKARLFVTDAENEKIFLEFVHEIQSASDALAQYVAVSSICVLLFVIRVLKNLDFQPRMVGRVYVPLLPSAPVYVCTAR